MTATAVIGDQLVFEEDYDENYSPSTPEIHEYAREIGIDPNNEPELLWLARQGIVAPLPQEWKPCQDVTGDIYYFNFSTGQSIWDHPCDEHYRSLVIQERECLQLKAAAAGGAKKVKKQKKEKKGKKEKKKAQPKTPSTLTSPLGPITSPLGSLGLLRGIGALGQNPLPGSASLLRGSSDSSGVLEPLKTSLPSPLGRGASSLVGTRQEERVLLALPGLHDEDDEEEKVSESEPSPRGSDRLLNNLHLDLDTLGGGLQYEDSEASEAGPAEERTEPELQDLVLSGDRSPELPSHQQGLEINVLSDIISPLEKDDREETHRDEERGDGGAKTESQVLSEDNNIKADQLVLHRSSPSPPLSSTPHHQKAQGLGGLQRPETSRGRRSQILDSQLEGDKPSSEEQGGPLEPRGRAQKEEEEEEGGDRAQHVEKKCKKEEGETMRKETEQEMQKEKECLLKKKERKMCLLQEQLRKEEEEEERRLKEESEERLRALQQHLLSKRREEEARLKEESLASLEELKESVQKEREMQQLKIRDESEVMLKELQITQEEERAAAHGRLEAQVKQDLERLRADSEEELQAERRRLLREQEEKLSCLKQELGDALQKIRQEVQCDHERKLEQLKEDHSREMNSIREKYVKEESALRESLLHTLQEDRELLQASHTLQLEKLRLQLDAQMQKAPPAHSDTAADPKTRRKMLGEEEVDLDGQIEALPRLVQERDQLKEELKRRTEEVALARQLTIRAREEKKEAMERMREKRDRARVETRRAMEDKERLEREVLLLKEKCDYFSQQISEQKHTEGGSSSSQTEQSRKQPTAPSSGWMDSSLHTDELDDAPPSAADSHGGMDRYRRYVSSHDAAIQKAKLVLEWESSRLMERRAALKAVQRGSSQDPNLTGETTRTLQQEARELAELEQTVQRGNSLLQKTEEHLQQLESSMAEELLLDDYSQLAGERKVTFDVTESDGSSSVEPPDGTGSPPTVPAKVQLLAESLQHISSQLNSVLGALGSLTQRGGSTPYTPLSISHPSLTVPATPQKHHRSPVSAAPPPLWSPGLQAGSTAAPLSSEPRAPTDLINSRWSQIFPGAAADHSSTRTSPVYPSYTPASEHLRVMQKSVEVDGQRLQGLIDSNKRWLDLRKKDTSVPLFIRYGPLPSQSSLVQLGLDDNNQIRVYHY
uniref:Centrosomal protein of 164 kDa n=2 Tax=Nothobranchius korthausae TaxID=1143690 RepID=A0A1A8HL23_9TELE